MKERTSKGPGPRELELQKMRLRGRAEKQARLESKAFGFEPTASTLKVLGATVENKPEVINELKLTMKRKVYVKRKKSIRPARRAKASR